jgi:chloramphenicol O-acetyltransferase type A
VLIWLLSAVVNEMPEFRMGLDERGRLGYVDVLHPSYVTLCDATKTISNIWTAWSEDFDAFYRQCLNDIEKYTDGSFMPQSEYPPNLFNISSVPWLDFSELNIGLAERNFLPIFTFGKFTERDGRVNMPLSMQLHHAVCDGYHAGQFAERLEATVNACEAWLK